MMMRKNLKRIGVVIPMMDKSDVVKALFCCLFLQECKECPYRIQRDNCGSLLISDVCQHMKGE